MSEETVVRHCSPTLAGLKTGSLLTAAFSSEADLHDTVRKLNKLLTKKGLRVLPLRYRDHRGLIYMYRPSKLSEDLQDSAAARLLRACGYPEASSEQRINHLRKRLSENREFPHEIGLFLGYPPADVEGFILNGARHSKLAGVWKVYGNVEEAQRQFAAFRHCTAQFLATFHMHGSLEKLAVSL